MGSSISIEYEELPNRKIQLDAGPYLKWKRYQARHRVRQDEMATVFAFDKSVLRQLPSPLHRQLVTEYLRRDAANLQRLRHPCILQLVTPLAEDKSMMAFTTKPVLRTLAECIKARTREFLSLESTAKSFSRLPLASRSGLLDIAEALHFLHRDAKLAHLNLSPWSIFVSPRGKWLVGGLGFCRSFENKSQSSASCEWSFSLEDPPTFRQLLGAEIEFDGSYPRTEEQSAETGRPQPSAPAAEPCLWYCAPEMTHPSKAQVGFASDMFAFGLLLIQLSSPPDFFPPIDVQSDKSTHYGGIVAENLSSRHHFLASRMVSRLDAASGSDTYGIQNPYLIPLLRSLLSPQPGDRLTADHLIQNPFFSDPNLRALRFLDEIHGKGAAQQSQFLRGFQQLLATEPDFSEDLELLRLRILPQLVELFASPATYSALVPTVFMVLRQINMASVFQSEEFWPRVRHILTAKQIQADVIAFVLSQLDFIVEMANPEIIRNDFLPFMVKCSRITEAGIQEKLLDAILASSDKLNSSSFHALVIPELVPLLHHRESSLQTRLKTLCILDKVIPTLGRDMIGSSILNALDAGSRLAASSAEFTLRCATTFRRLHPVLGWDNMASNILPKMVPMLSRECLNRDQFNELMKIVLSILHLISEQRLEHFRKEAEASKIVSSILGQDSNSSTVQATVQRDLLPPVNASFEFSGATTVPPRVVDPLAGSAAAEPSGRNIASLFDGTPLQSSPHTPYSARSSVELFGAVVAGSGATHGSYGKPQTRDLCAGTTLLSDSSRSGVAIATNSIYNNIATGYTVSGPLRHEGDTTAASAPFEFDLTNAVGVGSSPQRVVGPDSVSSPTSGFLYGRGSRAADSVLDLDPCLFAQTAQIAPNYATENRPSDAGVRAVAPFFNFEASQAFDQIVQPSGQPTGVKVATGATETGIRSVASASEVHSIAPVSSPSRSDPFADLPSSFVEHLGGGLRRQP